MQTKWKTIIKRGEILPSMAPLPAIFFKVDSICQQFIAKIHEHTRRHHNPSSHVHISGRKRDYKKKLWNIFLVYWRESGLKLESQIITRCFSPTEEIMLALHWKENHYPHLHKKDATESEIHSSTWIKGICIRFVGVFWSIQFNHMTTDHWWARPTL